MCAYALHRLLLPPSSLPAPPLAADAIALLCYYLCCVFCISALCLYFAGSAYQCFFICNFCTHTHTLTHALAFGDISVDRCRRINQQITIIFTVALGIILRFLLLLFSIFVCCFMALCACNNKKIHTHTDTNIRQRQSKRRLNIYNAALRIKMRTRLATSPASSKHVQTVCTPFVYWELWSELALPLTCSHTQYNTHTHTESSSHTDTRKLAFAGDVDVDANFCFCLRCKKKKQNSMAASKARHHE